MKGFTLTICACFLAGGAIASSAPEKSLRPLLRPGVDVTMAQASVAASMLVTVAAKMPAPAHGAMLRPVQRPVSPQIVAAAARPAGPLLGPATSLRPAPRTGAIVEKAFFWNQKKRKNSVCGDLDLQGDVVGDYGKSGGGCFIKDAVRLKSVSGVRLSQPSLMTCDTAKSLKTWIENGVQPAFGKQGPVAELKVAAHYACRTRNNRKGAKLSEHAKGRAIDISAFVMRDGDRVTVLKDWGKGRDGKALAAAHKSACGPFGTVLGPKSDRHHRDHFHVDTARYRSGAYCR